MSEQHSAEKDATLFDAFMEYLHPQLALYGIHATNEAHDQVDDLVQIARRVIPPSEPRP